MQKSKTELLKERADYIEKYYGGEIAELNKSGNAFEAAEELKSIMDKEGF